jgi:hypothetical protein
MIKNYCAVKELREQILYDWFGIVSKVEDNLELNPN